MNYLCFIPKALGDRILKTTLADWRVLARRIEARYPVSVLVSDLRGPSPRLDAWVFHAKPRGSARPLDRGTIKRISHEIDVFIGARAATVPQAA